MHLFRLLALLLLFISLLNQQTAGQSDNDRSISFTFGRGTEFKHGLRAKIFSVSLGPGRATPESRWMSQFGAFYHVHENLEYDDYSRADKANYYVEGAIFAGLFYSYGRFFRISRLQGIYVYAGTGLGVLQFKDLTLPYALPQAGINYTYSLLMLDLKITMHSALVNIGLNY